MKIIILCLTLSYIVCAQAQDYQFFSILPDIGAARNQSQFAAITADSNYLYVMGDKVSTLDSLGNNKDIDIHLSKFDYHGKFLALNAIKDSTMIRPYIGNNTPLFRINDSIYYYSIFSLRSQSSTYSITNLSKINVRTGKLLKNLQIPLSVSGDYGVETFVQSEFKEGRLVLVYNFQDRNIINSNYILELDTDLVINKMIKLPEFNQMRNTYRWINKNDDNNYELISDNYEYVSNQRTGKANLLYFKLDSNGNILKRADLNLPGNYYIGTGQTYTIHRNEDRTFVIALNEWLDDPKVYSVRPHIIKVSAEFDTILWLTNFSEYSGFMLEPDYYLMYICSMKDGSGFIASCASDYSKTGVADYGILFKASPNGDSLWLRKYQPIGWDTTRAWWMRFNQVICTPYNTLAVCARVSDRSDRRIKGWLLHLDSDGCLVPGCAKYVNSEEIAKGRIKAFKIYPNPSSSGMIYILSHIQSNEEYQIKLSDLQGKLIKSCRFKPTEGTQYLLELDQDIPHGEYLLSIEGKENKQVEKIIKL